MGYTVCQLALNYCENIYSPYQSLISKLGCHLKTLKRFFKDNNLHWSTTKKNARYLSALRIDHIGQTLKQYVDKRCFCRCPDFKKSHVKELGYDLDFIKSLMLHLSNMQRKWFHHYIMSFDEEKYVIFMLSIILNNLTFAFVNEDTKLMLMSTLEGIIQLVCRGMK